MTGDKKEKEPAKKPDSGPAQHRQERWRRHLVSDPQSHLEKLKQLLPTPSSSGESPVPPTGDMWEALAREVFGTPDLSRLPVEEAWQAWVQQKKITRIVDEAKWVKATNELREEYMQYARKPYFKHRYYDDETVLHHIREGKRFLFQPGLVIGPKGVIWLDGGILWADVAVMEPARIPIVWYTGRYVPVEHVDHKWALLFRLWDGSTRKIEIDHTSDEGLQWVHPHEFISFVADGMYRHWCLRKLLEDFKREARSQQTRAPTSQLEQIPCVLCEGTGHCFYCGGTGFVSQVSCEKCGGTGRCAMCSGLGKC